MPDVAAVPCGPVTEALDVADEPADVAVVPPTADAWPVPDPAATAIPAPVVPVVAKPNPPAVDVVGDAGFPFVVVTVRSTVPARLTATVLAPTEKASDTLTDTSAVLDRDAPDVALAYPTPTPTATLEL